MPTASKLGSHESYHPDLSPLIQRQKSRRLSKAFPEKSGGQSLWQASSRDGRWRRAPLQTIASLTQDVLAAVVMRLAGPTGHRPIAAFFSSACFRNGEEPGMITGGAEITGRQPP